MNETLIRASNAQLTLSGRKILSDINFKIKQGEIAIFIGPNGGGKTSLVKLLLGLYKPNIGQIFQKKGLKISYVPQKFKISAFLPLNVKRLLNLLQHYKRSELLEALALTQSEHLLDSQVVALSGGELQRVLIARAMLTKPDILVLDEALQGVDQAGEVRLNNLISDFSCKTGCAVIMVSHDLHRVMKSTDRVYCINGHICCQGKPSQVQHMDAFKNVFGAYAEQFAFYHHHHDHSHNPSDAEMDSQIKQKDNCDGCHHDH